MKIERYDDFINEKFFRKIYNSSKKKSPKKLDRITKCVQDILNFLAENDIYNWDRFMKMTPFDRDVINHLIDSTVKNMDELKEVRFKVRLELSDRSQLLDYKKELEDLEEYERCAIVVKKMSQK